MIDTSPLNKTRHKIISDNVITKKNSRRKPSLTMKQIVNGMRSIYHYPKEISEARERAASR